MAGTIRPMSGWETDLRAAVRRARDEPGSRAVVGPADGPGGPWVAFGRAADYGLVFESDAGGSRVLPEEEAIAAATEALAAWGLAESDPLTCFLEGVDRDPVEDDPYDVWAVLKALGRARWRRRPLSLAYDAHAGAVAVEIGYPNRRWAELSVVAPKPVNAAQARVLAGWGFSGAGDRWSGRLRADPEQLEAVIPSVWSRVRDVRLS
jgi:hypothetical protein